MRKNILDHGYVELIEAWGSDERIIESARMSTAKGFLGWGPYCSKCGIRMVNTFGGGISPADYERGEQVDCAHNADRPGDEKLLGFLWDNAHATPFEMAGMTIEVKAPIMVFREWHRHRTQVFNEMSARYVPLPNENYVPYEANVADRAQLAARSKNRQTHGASDHVPTLSEVLGWINDWLVPSYDLAQRAYEAGLSIGIPKELARLPVPVGRYSAMRASANLRNWLGFLKLRCATAAQWEIRQYANAVADLVREKFPRTYEVARESMGMP